MSKTLTVEDILQHKKRKEEGSDVETQIQYLLEIYSKRRDGAYFISEEWSIFEKNTQLIRCDGFWEFCDRTISKGETIIFPIELLNKDEYEITEWFDTLENEILIREDIKNLEYEMIYQDQMRDLLQVSIRHLQDPIWIEEKIRELEMKMKKRDITLESISKELERTQMEKNSFFNFISNDFDLCDETFAKEEMVDFNKKKYLLLSEENDTI